MIVSVSLIVCEEVHRRNDTNEQGTAAATAAAATPAAALPTPSLFLGRFINDNRFEVVSILPLSHTTFLDLYEAPLPSFFFTLMNHVSHEWVDGTKPYHTLRSNAVRGKALPGGISSLLVV